MTYPPPGAPASVPPAGTKPGLSQILYLATAGLGLVNLFLGFAKFAKGVDASFYKAGQGWVPALLAVGGLIAVTVILPSKGEKPSPGAVPAIVTLVGVFALLFSFSSPELFSRQGDRGAGFILLLIVGILQLAAAVLAYLYEVGILSPPAPKPAYSGPPPGGWSPQSGGFPQQQPPPGYGQQPPPGYQPPPPQQPQGPPPGYAPPPPQPPNYPPPGQQYPPQQ